ncbi:MAG: efflux RND transporter periplasmic adaptor subunit [Chitinophagaceae bacterium]|nr:efflux RND transporter periplasmic adaptor subunit [Chitinophagaceae bacterium]
MNKFFLLLMSVVAFFSCKQKQQEIKPQIKELTEAVYASGTLVPEEEYKLVSTVEGYMVRALVKEGDTVKKGQLLFTLSSSSRQVQEQTAQALVQKTIPVVSNQSPILHELEGRIELAKIRMQNDSLNFVRYKNLYEQDATSKSNYEKYLLQYQGSSKDHSNLQQQFRQQKLSLALQLQQAENQLALSRNEVNNGLLKSFTDGVLYDLYKREGDLVTPNQPVALIGRGKMIAKLLVDEDDLDKVKEGQKVLITMDAFPDKVFNATVHRIYPMLNKVEQSFRVDAVPDGPLPVGIYGLNIEANIVIGENKKVMVIPKNALMAGDSVMIKEGSKKAKVKISKGVEDKEWVQVKGGITEQSLLIVRL